MSDEKLVTLLLQRATQSRRRDFIKSLHAVALPQRTLRPPYLQIALAILLLILATVSAWAQSPITAEVDRTSVSTAEFVTLTVAVNTGTLNPPRPSLPPLDGFDVVGTSSSSQISMVNGKITTQNVYQYRLHPTQTGNLTIAPISISMQGQTYSTQPITIQVTQGNTSGQAPLSPNQSTPAPAPDTLNGQDFFVEATVDNATPYLGQQVIYTFRFYQAVNLLDQPRYDAPSFTGFWNQQQPDQNQYTVQNSGRMYRVTELRTVLFPTNAGPITIEPAVLTIPGGFFSTGQILHTQQVTLTVQSLPPNAPANFSGAVGNLSLTAEVDSTQGKVNDPITLKVTLKGEGNIENMPDPAWPDIPGWRSFESKATTNTELKNGKLSGQRVYERLLVPGVPGNTTIPAITYAYFDPDTKTYRVLSTNPIAVSVAPAEDELPVPTLPGNNKETVQRVATDIRHIKTVPPVLKSARAPLTAQPIYWLMWSLPLLALAGSTIWQRRQAHLQNNIGLARSLRAGKKAKRALAQARKYGNDPYSTAGQVLTTYLSDKFNQPIGGMTRPALTDLLKQHDLSAELVKRVQNCLTESDLGRFSPTASNPHHGERLLQEVEKLIDSLEHIL